MNPNRLRPWAALLMIAVCACDPSSEKRGATEIGPATAKALVAGLRAANETRAPWRCSHLGRQPPLRETIAVGRSRWTAEGDTLRLEKERALTIAVVTDARSGDTGAALNALAAALRRLRVDVVVVAGGFGTTADQLVATLTPLAKPPWITVAVPGDAEMLQELRRAVAALRRKGAPIVDGSAIRFLESAGALVATLPGSPYSQRLGGGAEGCQHTDADVSALLASVKSRAGQRATALVSPTAPRADGPSDVTTSGIHAGDIALREALLTAPVDLVIHGQPAEPGPPSGAVGKGPLWLGAGSIGTAPRFDDRGRKLPPSAMVVTLGGGELRWQEVRPLR